MRKKNDNPVKARLKKVEERVNKETLEGYKERHIPEETLGFNISGKKGKGGDKHDDEEEPAKTED